MLPSTVLNYTSAARAHLPRKLNHITLDDVRRQFSAGAIIGWLQPRHPPIGTILGNGLGQRDSTITSADVV
jgi:hypothetical protein